MLFDTDVLLRMLHISTKAAKEEDAGRNRRAGALKRAINALPSTFFSLLPTFVYFVVPIHPCRRLRHIKGTTPVSPQFLPPSICNTRTPPGMTHPAARRRSIEGANQRTPIGLFLSIPHKRGGVGPGNNDAKRICSFHCQRSTTPCRAVTV